MSPRQLYVKGIICQSIIRATAKNPAFLSLDAPGTIEALAASVATDLVSMAGLDSELQSKPEESNKTPISSKKEEVKAPDSVVSEIKAPDGKGKVEVPEHMKPKNRKEVKGVSRNGQSLSSASPDTPQPSEKDVSQFSAEDFDKLEEALSGSSSENEDGGWSQLDDSSFFNSGDGTVSYTDPETGENLVLGMSSGEMSQKASGMKQRLQENKEKGLIPKTTRPVSRVS